MNYKRNLCVVSLAKGLGLFATSVGRDATLRISQGIRCVVIMISEKVLSSDINSIKYFTYLN